MALTEKIALKNIIGGTEFKYDGRIYKYSGSSFGVGGIETYLGKNAKYHGKVEDSETRLVDAYPKKGGQFQRDTEWFTNNTIVEVKIDDQL